MLPNKRAVRVSNFRAFLTAVVIFVIEQLINLGDLIRFLCRHLCRYAIFLLRAMIIFGQQLNKHLHININKFSRQLKSRISNIQYLISNLSFPKPLKLPPLPRFPHLTSHIPHPPSHLPHPTSHFPHLILKLRFFLLGILFTLIFAFLPFVFYTWLNQLPHPRQLMTRDIPQTTKIFDRRGRLLYSIYGQQNRTLVPLAEIPDYLIKATIAIEDRDFYNHQGISFRGIVRAAKENLFNGRLQGGSTLTQQLIKSALLTPEITISRKVKEIIIAAWTERLYSKEQILEMYFNQIPYGGTAWGVAAAAETYFGKKVNELSLSQAALLAGLPTAPSLNSPHGSHPELAKIKQGQVLEQMRRLNFISKDEYEKAINEELNIKPPRTDIKAPHFVMFVRELLEAKYGAALVEQGGLQIYTSLDLNIQEAAQIETSAQIEKLGSLNIGNGAALIIKPSTGEILAMVGSRDYFDTLNDGNVNVVLAKRQPGSAIKPINYAAALLNGQTAASIINDQPIAYQIPNQPVYRPVNYDNRFHGPISLRSALANSYNVPAVITLNKIGVETMITMGEKMGITTWKDKSRFGLSLTLGGGEVTMYDLSRSYAILANLGRKVEFKPIFKVIDSRGRILEEALLNDQGVRVLPTGVAFILSDILADNLARAPAFGPNSALNIPGRRVSVKTGTTNDKRDNWTIGFANDYLVAVWVGNNDNSPMGYLVSGITGAALIWRNLISQLLANLPADQPVNLPDDVVAVPICSLTGTLPCANCPTKNEYFLKGTEPKTSCKIDISPKPSPTPF